MQKWEYKTEVVKLKDVGFLKVRPSADKVQEILKSAGNDGWELVSTIPITSQSGWGSATSSFVFLFKRTDVELSDNTK